MKKERENLLEAYELASKPSLDYPEQSCPPFSYLWLNYAKKKKKFLKWIKNLYTKIIYNYNFMISLTKQIGIFTR